MDIERIKSSLLNNKARVEIAEKSLKEETKRMKEYMKANELFAQLDSSSAMKQKYDREVADFNSRIEFHKNTLRYTLDDVVRDAERMNEGMEPYISGTDGAADIAVRLKTNKIVELENEINNLKKQRDTYPEYNKQYTEAGKKEFEDILGEIDKREKEIKELKDDISNYQKRMDFINEYKENLVIKAECKKTADKYGIQLESAKSKNPNPQPQPENPNPQPQPENPNPQPQPENPNPQPQPENPNPQPQPENPNPQPQPENPNPQPQPENPNPQPQPENPDSDPENLSSRKIDITIGREVSFNYRNGNKNIGFAVDSKTLKRDVNKLDDENKIHYIEEILGEELEPSYEKNILKNIDRIDDTVLSALYDIKNKNGEHEDIKEMLKETMTAYLYSTNNNKQIQGLDICYDRSDLSKRNIPIISRLFKGQMSRKQKNYINEMSEVSAKYTRHIGEYNVKSIRDYIEAPFKKIKQYLPKKKEQPKAIGDGKTRDTDTNAYQNFINNLYFDPSISNTNKEHIHEKYTGIRDAKGNVIGKGSQVSAKPQTSTREGTPSSPSQEQGDDGSR